MTPLPISLLDAVARRTLHESVAILREVGLAPEDLQLGGGTALAALWLHRQSLDIDLFLRERGFRKILEGSSERCPRGIPEGRSPES